jgi:predicted RNA-binding protein with RPS1 domain
MRKKENLTVIKRSGDKTKIYCQEPYAQELYDLMYGRMEAAKDIRNGDLLKIISMKFISEDEVEVLCDNHDTLYFLVQKEKKFFEILGMTLEIFRDWVTTQDCLDYFKKFKTYIQVENAKVRKGSLHAAHLQTIAEEFREQIINPTRAYVSKILSKNQGGFLVEVQGIKAFLPGSLAAANKIVDFDEYIGKQIYVMIEDFLASSSIFVVSYKKYLENILPSKLGELERDQYMSGTVTGTSKFGVFVEFDEIFTGLLHVSEMSPTTLEKFNNGEIKSGNNMSIWLKDIRDNKLILTESDPSIRKNEMEEFRGKIEGNFKEATIVSVKPHGALMEVEKGVLGLLPVKEMKKSGRRLSVGESLQVFIKRVDTSTGKIYLTLTDERVTAEV